MGADAVSHFMHTIEYPDGGVTKCVAAVFHAGDRIACAVHFPQTHVASIDRVKLNFT